jgi:hypothetical protein
VSVEKTALFAFGLFVVQIVEGTPLYFSVGCMAFVMLTALAFNAAGGLTRASGGYVFFFAMLDVIVGLCYKAYLGEPAQSNLRDPKTTILVYVAGMFGMFATVQVSRRMRRKTGLLQNLLKYDKMSRASVGCLVVGIGGPFFLNFLGNIGAKLGSAFNQLNQLVPLAIIIGVMYEIYRSGGRRSINGPILLAGGYFFFFFGLLGYSKQGLLLPILCWLLPATVLRFRFTALQIVYGIFATFLIFHYLVPYSQIGRNSEASQNTLGERIDASFDLLVHADRTRAEYLQQQDHFVGPNDVHYFTKSGGFFDRLQFIAVDDALIDETDKDGEFGLSPVYMTFLNALPRFVWPDKPYLNFGNVYAHQIGGLPDEDTTTGISFSPVSEAYHLAKWYGVLLVAPLIWFLVFVVFDSLFGDLRATPWGLLVLAQVSHTAPEGALTGAIYFLTFGVAIFVFCALFATWIAPYFAVFLLGKDKQKVVAMGAPASILSPRALSS